MTPELLRKARNPEMIQIIPAFLHSCVPQRHVRLSRGDREIERARRHVRYGENRDTGLLDGAIPGSGREQTRHSQTKIEMNPELLRKARKQELIRIIPAFLRSSEICPC
jgi:hypothetical protein